MDQLELGWPNSPWECGLAGTLDNVVQLAHPKSSSVLDPCPGGEVLVLFELLYLTGRPDFGLDTALLDVPQ